MSFDVNAYLSKTAKLAEDYALTLMPQPGGMAATLFDAMSYSFFAGGKRFRPALAYAAAEAVCGDGAPSVPFGVAIEMIHTYSLIHDDLPAMDDDDLRRGKPTCHIKYGEAMAILAGDALLTDAFTHLTSPEMAQKYGAGLILRCVNVIARSAGGGGMVAGQAIDVLSEGLSLSLPALEYLHIHKTGALIRASVLTGAFSVQASPEQEKTLALYADRVGLAFQIADDILDVVGETSTLGKPVGSDEGKSKATYPALMGITEAQKRLSEVTAEAVSLAGKFGTRGEALAGLANFVASRKS